MVLILSILGFSEVPRIPKDYSSIVQHAISLIGPDSTAMDNTELVEYLIENGIDEFEASELVIFLPIVFCRKLLPDMPWHEHYVEHKGRRSSRKKYMDSARYCSIWTAVQVFIDSEPGGDRIAHIVGRSAEFKAINELLLKGGAIDEITLTETAVLK